MENQENDGARIRMAAENGRDKIHKTDRPDGAALTDFAEIRENTAEKRRFYLTSQQCFLKIKRIL